MKFAKGFIHTLVTNKRTGITRGGAKLEVIKLNGAYAQIVVNMFIRGIKRYCSLLNYGHIYVYTGNYVLNETINHTCVLNDIPTL